jgi:hypothetical protein
MRPKGPERANGGDAPIRVPGQPGETSSLGLFWPPKETDFHRVKGFYKQAILSPEDFIAFRGVWDEFSQSPRFTTQGVESENGKEQNFSRITLRAVVSDEFLRTHADELQQSVEAIIPLSNNGPFAGTSLVYFGENHPERNSDEHTMKSCVSNLRVALSTSEKEPEQMIEKAQNNGYDISLIDKNHIYSGREKLVKQLFELYRPFGWSKKQIIELLNSDTRLLATAKRKSDDTIVSAGIAEMGREIIQFGADQSYPLDIVELTDAATLISDENQGLYGGVSTMLLGELAHKYKATEDEVIIFAESNASATGVLVTSNYQGRTFSATIGGDYGYPESGMLPQHVPILDRGEQLDKISHKYNNFFQTFINKDKLLEKYGYN